jgi:hypothetical protein
MVGIKMKKLFLFFTIMSVCHLVHARTMTEMITDSVGQQEDELAICYLFKNNKVAKKAPCVYETQYGSGGYISTSYSFDPYSFVVESSADDPVKLNGALAKDYRRDARSLRILNNSNNDNLLYCFRVAKKNIDFCTKHTK